MTEIKIVRAVTSVSFRLELYGMNTWEAIIQYKICSEFSIEHLSKTVDLIRLCCL